MSPAHTGGILIKRPARMRATGELRQSIEELATDCVPLAQSAVGHVALDGEETYLYLFSREPAAIDARVLSRVLERAGTLPGLGGVTLAAAKLVPVFDVAGASRGEDAPFHYVVETNVISEHEADLNAWYDREHMPGLAACPGSVRARRFRNPEGSPRYHACYDLVRAETLGSEPWLAVRHTAWSARVRPHFRNTKRTMFKRLFEIEL